MTIKTLALSAGAALAIALVPGAANAMEHITGNGIFQAGTTTTGEAKAGSSYKFSFDVEDFKSVGGRTAGIADLSNVTYTLNGHTVTATLESATFYTKAGGGMFDLTFSNGDHITFNGAQIVDSTGKFADNGRYLTTLGDGSAGKGQVVLSQSGAAPEPAAWAMMIGGFGVAGTALRRRKAAVAA